MLDQEFVDQVIIVDDSSSDKTVEIASKLSSAIVIIHEVNKGYGVNQKTCYQAALDEGGDIIIMLHPDYQYTPKLISAMVSLIGNELYQCVLGSRILGGHAHKNGMPLWRYISNRFLTFFVTTQALSLTSINIVKIAIAGVIIGMEPLRMQTPDDILN